MNFFSTIMPYFSSFIKPNWTVYKDVQYGTTTEEKADLYLLNHGVRPCVIFIHGGGWSSGDKSAYEGRARKYALAGFHVISINYRLAKMDDKTTHWPAQLQDVQAAVRWVRQNAIHFRIDPNRIGVGGDSAGGHLALMLGANLYSVSGDRSHLYSGFSPFPNCVLNMFGPCDLSMEGMKEFIAALPLFNEKSYEQVPDLYKAASPINKITAFFPPTIIMHGTSDETVPYAESVLLDKKLTEVNVPHKFITFNGGHEFGKMSSTDQMFLEMKGLYYFMEKFGL